MYLVLRPPTTSGVSSVESPRSLRVGKWEPPPQPPTHPKQREADPPSLPHCCVFGRLLLLPGWNCRARAQSRVGKSSSVLCHLPEPGEAGPPTASNHMVKGMALDIRNPLSHVWFWKPQKSGGVSQFPTCRGVIFCCC